MNKTKALLNVKALLHKEGHDTDDINEKTPLLGYIDSLDKGTILYEMERELNVNIHQDVVEEWKTIGDVVNTYQTCNTSKDV